MPFFRNVGASVIADVTRLLRARDYPARAVIVRRGERGDCMYFIAAGEVEVRLRPQTVRLGPGEFFGEIALLTGGPRNATIVAMQPCTLLTLDIVDFRQLLGRQPELARVVSEEAERRRLVNEEAERRLAGGRRTEHAAAKIAAQADQEAAPPYPAWPRVRNNAGKAGRGTRRMVERRFQLAFEKAPDAIVKNLFGDEALGAAQAIEPAPPDGDVANLLLVNHLQDGGAAGIAGALQPG